MRAVYLYVKKLSLLWKLQVCRMVCWKAAGVKSQTTGRSSKSKNNQVGRQANAGHVGENKIMDFRGNNSQNQMLNIQSEHQLYGSGPRWPTQVKCITRKGIRNPGTEHI